MLKSGAIGAAPGMPPWYLRGWRGNGYFPVSVLISSTSVRTITKSGAADGQPVAHTALGNSPGHGPHQQAGDQRSGGIDNRPNLDAGQREGRIQKTGDRAADNMNKRHDDQGQDRQGVRLLPCPHEYDEHRKQHDHNGPAGKQHPDTGGHRLQSVPRRGETVAGSVWRSMKSPPFCWYKGPRGSERTPEAFAQPMCDRSVLRSMRRRNSTITIV